MAVGLPTAVDFQFRELPAFRTAKDVIDCGTIGAVTRVEVIWHVESYAQRKKLWSWKTDRTQGGGVLTVLGTHVLYLVEWLLSRVEALTARFDDRATRTFAPPGAAEDGCMMIMTLAGGAHVAVSVSNARPGETLHRWSIGGEQGVMVLENPTSDYMHGFSLTHYSRAGSVLLSRPDPVIPEDGRLAPFATLAERFLGGVGGRRVGIQAVVRGRRAGPGAGRGGPPGGRRRLDRDLMTRPGSICRW